jgi:hypothetical protein
VTDPLEPIRGANPVSAADADDWFASAAPPDPATFPPEVGEGGPGHHRRGAAAWVAWSMAAAAVVVLVVLVVGRGPRHGRDVVVVTSVPVAGSTTVPTTTSTTPASTTSTFQDSGPPPGSEGTSVAGLDAAVSAHPEVFLGSSGGGGKPSVAVYKGSSGAAAALLAPFPADRFTVRTCPMTAKQGQGATATVAALVDPLGLTFAVSPDAATCTISVIVGGATPEQIAGLGAGAPSWFRFSSAGTVVRTTRPG